MGFRTTFPEHEALTDDQLSDAARLFGTLMTTLISHPDALKVSMFGPEALQAWLTNMALGTLLGTFGRAGVVNVAKAAELVADITSKGDGEAGHEHARNLAKGFRGQGE